MTVLTGVGDLAAGVAILCAGLAAWSRARQSRTGPLLVLAGTTWLAGDMSSELVHLHRGPMVHVLLTFPTGRTRSKPILLIIALAYVDGAVPAVARAPWPTLVLGAAVVFAAAWRWSAGAGLQRRARRVPLLSACLMIAPLSLAAVSRLAGSGTPTLAALAYDAAVAGTAVALAAELLSSRTVRAAATGLVVDLADNEPRALRDAIARTVGDPDLTIAYRLDEEWVDESGRMVALRPADQMADRVVTFVLDGGTPVAALVHDPAALHDTGLATSVEAAVRLVLANVRLQAEDETRMTEVSGSRRRLVEAGDEQRRRLREQLRGGAEATLDDVSRRLAHVVASCPTGTATGLKALADELDAARTDLTSFAQGIHPKALTELGLAAALGDLAVQAVVPVTVRAPQRRFLPSQEAAVFFVCSEALANTAKHAEATRVSIEVIEEGSWLAVRVVDDGRGGADVARGSGLRGLIDRVEALGGRLSIRSPSDEGTRLEARLPLPGAVA